MRILPVLIAAALASIVSARPAAAAPATPPAATSPAAAAPIATPSSADSDLNAYAIVVGSNLGGAGQSELRFAESDARQVADVLRELGGYRAADVALVLHPDPAAVNAALERVAARVAADRAAGRRSVVFFYYSGHAKATALDLGAGELSLAGLRERLLSLPSTLTVVVLDACQSGAFSRIKGAEPAADFSFNSRARLDATGVAVMASSSASELSQESDLLRSSYFTHHLLVGLRGAGDANGDGAVSLDEAYRYAYHQTLVATAATAVGRQHVSLEVDLKGQGEVALTYPARASARVELPAALEGDVLLERLPAQAVIAEVHKARGRALRVAVAPGAYRLLIRRGDYLERCPVTAAENATTTVALDRCDRVPYAETAAKGLLAPMGPTWQLDVTFGLGAEPDDAYIQTLRDFEYTGNLAAPHLAATLLYRVHPLVTVGGEVDASTLGDWKRGTDKGPLMHHWDTIRAGGVARAEWQRPGATLVPFAQAGVGLALAITTFSDADSVVEHEGYLGWHLAAAAGFTWTPFRHWGFVTRLTWAHVPVVDNLIGDTHDAGGISVMTGVHLER